MVGFSTSLFDLLKLLTSARPGNFPNCCRSAYYIKTLCKALCEIEYWCHTVVNVLAQGNRYRKYWCHTVVNVLAQGNGYRKYWCHTVVNVLTQGNRYKKYWCHTAVNVLAQGNRYRKYWCHTVVNVLAQGNRYKKYWCHTVVNVLAQGNKYREHKQIVKKEGFVLRKTSCSALMQSHSPKRALSCPNHVKI